MPGRSSARGPCGMRWSVGDDSDLSAVFGWLAQRGRLRTADITGCFWHDVDTVDDLRDAEARWALRGNKEDLQPA